MPGIIPDVTMSFFFFFFVAVCAYLCAFLASAVPGSRDYCCYGRVGRRRNNILHGRACTAPRGGDVRRTTDPGALPTDKFSRL